MKTLVLGGTGTVGSHVVRELLLRGTDVTVLSRSEERIAALPAGVRGIKGDLLEVATVRSAFSDIDAVFMANAIGPSEMHQALMAVQGAHEAGVKRFVYLSIHRLEEALHLPHFAAKLPVEKALAASGMTCTNLRAGNFFQNDYWYKETMLQYGLYPQPLGTIGVSRVDVRDVAAAAVVALSDECDTPGTLNLVGPDQLNGPDVARAWSNALGRTIKYAGDDLNLFENQALQFMPDWMAYELRLMYAYMQERGMAAADSDVNRLAKFLGRSPIAFEDFTQQTKMDLGAWR